MLPKYDVWCFLSVTKREYADINIFTLTDSKKKKKENFNCLQWSHSSILSQANKSRLPHIPELISADVFQKDKTHLMQHWTAQRVCLRCVQKEKATSFHTFLFFCPLSYVAMQIHMQISSAGYMWKPNYNSKRAKAHTHRDTLLPWEFQVCTVLKEDIYNMIKIPTVWTVIGQRFYRVDVFPLGSALLVSHQIQESPVVPRCRSKQERFSEVLLPSLSLRLPVLHPPVNPTWRAWRHTSWAV